MNQQVKRHIQIVEHLMKYLQKATFSKVNYHRIE